MGGRGAQWKYLKHGDEPIGLLFQPGKKRGSVSVYLATGKVHLSGGDDAKEALLVAVEAWTLPWGSGHRPTATQAKAELPPYPKPC